MNPDSHIKIVVDKKQVDLMFNRFESQLPNVLRVTMLEAMQRVGLTATGKYMYLHSVSSDEYGAGSSGLSKKTTRPDKLGILYGRLSRSLTENFNFLNGGGEKESIRIVKTEGGSIVGIFGSEVPYAAIHEFGGTIHHTNLFGRGIKADIQMPARPYLRPALKDETQNIYNMFKTAIDTLAIGVNA